MPEHPPLVTLEMVGGLRDGERLQVAPPPPPDVALPALRDPPEAEHPTSIDEIPGLAVLIYRRELAPPVDGVHLYHFDEDASD